MCVYMYIYIYVYACMYVCMCIHIHIYVYIHTRGAGDGVHEEEDAEHAGDQHGQLPLARLLQQYGQSKCVEHDFYGIERTSICLHLSIHDIYSAQSMYANYLYGQSKCGRSKSEQI